ncbi:MAG: hypothetical protein ACK4N5_27240, partial [Myxococcales bacterium]
SALVDEDEVKPGVLEQTLEHASGVTAAPAKKRRALTSGRRALALPPGRGMIDVTARGVVLLQGTRVGRAPLKRILPEGTYDVALVDSAGRPLRNWTAVVRAGHTTVLAR